MLRDVDSIRQLQREVKLDGPIVSLYNEVIVDKQTSIAEVDFQCFQRIQDSNVESSLTDAVDAGCQVCIPVRAEGSATMTVVAETVLLSRVGSKFETRESCALAVGPVRSSSLAIGGFSNEEVRYFIEVRGG